MPCRASRKHLFLALNRKGLGEAILGLQLASGLRAEGDEVFFLAHDSNARLFNSQWPHLTFGDHAAPLLEFLIGTCLAEQKATSIILSDYLTSQLFIEGAGQRIDMVLSRGVPVLAIDTWGSSLAPQSVDMLYSAPDQPVPAWPDNIKSLCPVPILNLSVEGSYRSLPSLSPATEEVRTEVRNRIGLPAHAKAVLFCTAEWQHPGDQPSIRTGTKSKTQWDVARNFAYSVPKLIAAYIRKLTGVHLVHVGPEAYQLQDRLGDRYHWLPPLAPPEFDRLVPSMDLLLTANISATTIAKAIVTGVPVLTLQNSLSASTPEEIEPLFGIKDSKCVRSWLGDSMPLFPFALWPLGYYRFVTPLLRDNPYLRAIDVVELLDETRVMASMERLLFNASARADQLHNQTAYLLKVRSLHTGAQIVQAALA